MAISKKEQTTIRSNLNQLMRDHCATCIFGQHPGCSPEQWCMSKDLSCYQNYSEIRKIIDKNYKEV